MFCPKCGKQLPEDAKFCAECGARITAPSADAATASTPQVPAAATPQMPAIQTPQQTPGTQTPQQVPGAYAPQQTPTAPANAGGSTRRTRAVLIAVIAVAVLLVGGVVGFLVYRNAQQQAAAQAAAQAAYEAAHTKHAVVFKVDVPGYADATASKIPVRVTGTDLDGATVDEDGYVDAEGEGLSLLRGTYTVTVVVSPLTSDGTVYDVSSTSWNVSIGDDVEPGAPVDATAQPITLTPISDYTSVPDEELARIFDYAVRSGLDQATADTYRTATENRIQAAKDQKAADDAATAAKAAIHYENEYFSIDFPEDWRSNFTVTETDGDVACHWKDASYYGEVEYSKEYTFKTINNLPVVPGGSMIEKMQFSVTLFETSRGTQEPLNLHQNVLNLGNTSSNPSYSVAMRSHIADPFSMSDYCNEIENSITVK